MNSLQQPALIRLPWKNRLRFNGRIAKVQAKIGLPGSCVRTMARPTVVGEYGSDVARVIDHLAGHLQGSSCDGKEPDSKQPT
jgi:hypothetical protein